MYFLLDQKLYEEAQVLLYYTPRSRFVPTYAYYFLYHNLDKTTVCSPSSLQNKQTNKQTELK